MKRSCVLVPMLLAALLAGAQTETRTIPVDFVLLVDRSLSMQSAMEDLKRYLAESVVGPAMLPGDRAEVLAFYGETEVLWSGEITGELEKAALLRTLRSIVPDGRFTDIGAALDKVDAILARLGSPERPKFVLLLTDERQEAPPDSPYVSNDYSIRHPRLEFSRRVDLGSFRAITIGLGVEARVDAAAKGFLTLLANTPSGDASSLPGAPSSGGSGDPSVATESRPAAAEPGAGEDASARTVADGSTLAARLRALPSWALAAGGLALVAAMAVFLIALLRSRRGKDAEPRT